MTSEHRAEEFLDEEGNPIGGDGGGGDITSGSPKIEPAQISYVAAATGAKAFMRLNLDSLPSNNDVVRFTSYFNELGQSATNPLDFTWKSSLSNPHELDGAGPNVLVRIEGTTAASIANLVSALNDPTYEFDSGGLPASFSDTWTATNPSGSELRIEQDFDGTGPNGNQGFADVSSSGKWTDIKQALSASSVNWTDGADAQIEQINSVTIQDFLFELGSSGPTVFLDGNVKDGDHTPEVLGTITDLSGIIDLTTGITFGSVVVGAKTFRTITVPPTKNQGLTGIATVEWTWRSIPFSAQIQKV